MADPKFIYSCTRPRKVKPRDWPDCGRCKVATCGYSRCFEYNEKWAEQGGICPYEHCIENMPLPPFGNNPRKACPVFGHECPGREEDVQHCRELYSHFGSLRTFNKNYV